MLPVVVAINAFPTDTRAELDLVEKKCNELGVNVALCPPPKQFTKPLEIPTVLLYQIILLHTLSGVLFKKFNFSDQR